MTLPLERPDGFDEKTWANLTDKQRRHVMGYVSDPETLLEGEEQSSLATTIYAQCWLAIKRTMLETHETSTTLTLEQIDALEQYALTGMLAAMAAHAGYHASRKN